MLTTSVLMCHAPIVIPAVAGARSRDCAKTTSGMRRAAAHLVRSRPDVLIVISPHAPREAASFGVSRAPIALDFHAFGAPLAMHFPAAPEVSDLIASAAGALDVPCFVLQEPTTDHGAAVPLYFVQQAGFAGPTVVVSLPFPNPTAEQRFGLALQQAAARSSQRWALLASGDLSHRLQLGAPAGYHPQAASFDQELVAAIQLGDYRRACNPAPELQALAAEDAVASLRVACVATDYDRRGNQFYSYEGPFGVGYAAAVLYDVDAPPAVLTEIARDAIALQLAGRHFEPVALQPPWETARAVFVTLRDRAGELRGCVGSLAPSESSLSGEVARTAVAAAVQDPRFAPLEATELAELRIEVSVLEAAERIDDETQLDPAEYGVVVSDGARRGVLLPAVAGIDTVATQLAVAKRKAGIDERAAVTIERFRVHKVHN